MCTSGSLCLPPSFIRVPFPPFSVCDSRVSPLCYLNVAFVLSDYVMAYSGHRTFGSDILSAQIPVSTLVNRSSSGLFISEYWD